MASFAINPTFTPLKTPFRSSYALFRVVSGLFWIVAELTRLVMALFRHCCGVDCGLTMD